MYTISRLDTTEHGIEIDFDRDIYTMMLITEGYNGSLSDGLAKDREINMPLFVITTEIQVSSVAYHKIKLPFELRSYSYYMNYKDNEKLKQEDKTDIGMNEAILHENVEKIHKRMYSKIMREILKVVDTSNLKALLNLKGPFFTTKSAPKTSLDDDKSESKDKDSDIKGSFEFDVPPFLRKN